MNQCIHASFSFSVLPWSMTSTASSLKMAASSSILFAIFVISSSRRFTSYKKKNTVETVEVCAHDESEKFDDRWSNGSAVRNVRDWPWCATFFFLERGNIKQHTMRKIPTTPSQIYHHNNNKTNTKTRSCTCSVSSRMRICIASKPRSSSAWNSAGFLLGSFKKSNAWPPWPCFWFCTFIMYCCGEERWGSRHSWGWKLCMNRDVMEQRSK